VLFVGSTPGEPTAHLNEQGFRVEDGEGLRGGRNRMLLFPCNCKKSPSSIRVLLSRGPDRRTTVGGRCRVGEVGKYQEGEGGWRTSVLEASWATD